MDTSDTHTSQSGQTQGQVCEENAQQIPNQQQPYVQEASRQRIPEQQRHKLHHSYIWLSAVRSLPYVLMALVVSIGPAAGSLIEDLGNIDASNMGLPIIFGATVLFLLILEGIIIGAAAIGYRYRWYEFGVSEFSSYWGIFNKNRSHIPYQRIQSVNEKMSLLQRIVGVCTVTVETAGGENNKALVIPYVEKSAAERIRREVFMRKSLMASGLTPQEADERMQALVAQERMQAESSFAAANAPVGLNDFSGAAVGTPGAPIPPWELQAQQQAVLQQTQQMPQGVPQQIQQGAFPQSQQGASPTTNVLDMPADVMDDMRGIFAHAEVDTGKVACEFGLSNKELLLSALSSKTSFAFVLLGVISALATLLGGLVDARIISSSEAVYSAAWQAMSSSFGMLFLLFILGILLVLWLISVGSSCLTYAGFRSRRRGNRIEVERGLITHVFSGMDVERIQSIHIHQSFFQRLLKCCSVAYGRVGAMEENGNSDGANSSEADKLVVHPFLPLSRVQEVIEGLTPEYRTLPQPTRHVDKKALRRALTRRVVWQGLGFWLLVVLVCTWMVLGIFVSSELSQEVFSGMTLLQVMLLITGIVGALIVVVAVFEAINAVLWYRLAAMGWDRFGFTIVNGGFSTDSVTIPRTKIQAALIRTNPLQRHAKVASVIVNTAAGVGSTRHRLIDVSRGDAEEWLTWACPRGGNSGGSVRVES
jgi:putative membrane protein